MRKTLIAGALFLSLVCLAGCGSGDGITDGVRMNYSTGRASDKVYDRELFYNNTNETVIADPGVVYVSEEESEEYGGWYYMYGTGSSASYTTGDGNLYAFQCFRSKNLVDWQLAGEDAKGYSLMLTSSDWVNLSSENIWAPEVIYNPTDGKFYMYFSAEAKPSATVSSPSAAFDKLYLGIAVGDTPVSFRPIGAEDALFNAEGELVTSAQPPIDFERAYDCGIFSVIDASPFLDDDGQLYLYFNKHTDSNPKTPSLQGVWGMKMKDFVTPDYSTLTLICSPGVVSAEGGLSEDGKPEVMSRGSAYSFSEGSVNEGPFMVKHDGTYYMTYSANGYSSPSYSVHQAISDDPLEGFVKPQTTDGNPVLLSSNAYVAGTGHHSIVKAGDDYMIVYARMGNPSNYAMGWIRMVGIDEILFTQNAAGQTVMTSNGPSYTLQPLPSAISGYSNVAKTAQITVSDGEGAEYLNDGIIPYYSFSENRTFSGKAGTQITLSWQTAVSLSSIMVYNTDNYDNAFKNIESVRIYFAQTPDWASRDYLFGVMENVEFPSDYLVDGTLMQGAAAVMCFEEVKVSRIVITLGEKYEMYDAMGELNETILIPEIVCLGKEG